MKFALAGLLWLFIVFFLQLAGSLMMFWDFLSFFMVGALPLLIVFGRYGIATFVYTDAEHRNSVVKSYIQATIASGLFSFLVGVVVVLANTDAPEMMGPGFAVATISLLYSTLFSMTALIFGGLKI